MRKGGHWSDEGRIGEGKEVEGCMGSEGRMRMSEGKEGKDGQGSEGRMSEGRKGRMDGGVREG